MKQLLRVWYYIQLCSKSFQNWWDKCFNCTSIFLPGLNCDQIWNINYQLSIRPILEVFNNKKNVFTRQLCFIHSLSFLALAIIILPLNMHRSNIFPSFETIDYLGSPIWIVELSLTILHCTCLIKYWWFIHYKTHSLRRRCYILNQGFVEMCRLYTLYII